MTGPRRIQRKRMKGWRMPEGAVYVGRPTKWGNYSEEGTAASYRKYLEDAMKWGVKLAFHELRGRDLVCWCQLDQSCHADVLLEFANKPERNPSKATKLNP